MPKLLVSKDNMIIDERQFQESFLVIGGERLYWHFYPSENGFWRTEIYNKKSISKDSDVTGSQQFTITYTGRRYEVNCVLPDWSLSIDDVILPKGFYNTFEVVWRKLKVNYQGYEFLFVFDIADIETETIAMPKPIY